MEQAMNDVVFVRHAESEFNKEVLEYVARKQIAYDWEHLSKDHEFLAQHKYSYHLLDATITAQGRK